VTAQTATASTVHHPIGKPGGPGLFHVKGLELPAYIQNVRNAMMRNGADESRATQMAIGIVRNWKDGHDGHGNKVSAEVQAAATKAIAEYEADRAKAHASRSEHMTDQTYDADGLDASWDGTHDDLPDVSGLTAADFDAVDDGPPADMSRAAKLGTGARFANLKASLAKKGASDPGALAAFIGRKKFGKGKFVKLASAARKRKTGKPAMASRSLFAGEIYRAFPIESCEVVRSGDRTGRTVEAYAAIFNDPAEIEDHEGHYKESIAPVAFNKRLADLERSNSGFAAVKVLYNHGMTIHGTPSDRFSIPVGVPEHIGVDSRGMITRTRYLNTPLADEILECVNERAINTQSFTGRIIRSNPQLREGQMYRASWAGGLPEVTRVELGLREYGICPFPAYQAAEVVGVRMAPVGTWSREDNADTEPAPDEGEEAVTYYVDPEALLPHGEAARSEPDPLGHPTPSLSNRMWRLRLEEQLSRSGISLGRE
jgi:HK97 family phage prohead protease